MSEATAEASTCTDPDFAMTKAACGCMVPGCMVYANGRAECYKCQPKRASR
ncbi:hypothetical protein IU487_22300 [Nocardia puris]|uniref:hypothetical protein n=1 Tax=Nocardia puris TaxID=208602 RepID=UPI001894693C|nr:hypothetical protein [Nocardia puris]MBF6213752.1 hypothetical protein [Nocardia puris]